jgi:hypothetical protein
MAIKWSGQKKESVWSRGTHFSLLALWATAVLTRWRWLLTKVHGWIDP